jgi:formylglycine-generating enzyme required for sulfatase activity
MLPCTWFRLVLLSGLLIVLGFVVPGWSEQNKGKKQPKAITNSIGMKLVLIPAGKFKMGTPKDEGNDDESPQHEVEITKAFYLGAHEVTQGQFRKVMGYNPSYFSSDGKGKPGVKYDYAPAEGKQQVKGQDTDDFPVENVSWEEAVEFCKKLTARGNKAGQKREYRLPTEAEWEYACRGGAPSSTKYHFGNSISSKLANFEVNLIRTSKVGSYKPNAFGLYDMHGNVWEWCADWYAEDYYARSPRRDPTGPAKGSERVARGGSWYDLGPWCRSALRGRTTPGSRGYGIGFRVAQVPSRE